MEFIKKEFKAGDILSALDLNNMGDGIEEAINLAQEGAAGAANMEKGTGENATQQLLDRENVDFSAKENKDDERNSLLVSYRPDDATTYDCGSTGPYAASFNSNTIALGSRSFAINNKTLAKGDESFAQGYQSVALGGSSSATGIMTLTLALAAHAEGTKTLAAGENSHAEGNETAAKGNNSHAEGSITIAEGNNSHAEGFSSEAIGAHSHAEGNNTIAQGVASHAEGDGTQALHENSHAGGYKTKTGKDNQTVIGQFNEGKSSTFFEVGIGTSDVNRQNAFEVREDGTIVIKYGSQKYSLQKILEALNAFIDSAKLTD